MMRTSVPSAILILAIAAPVAGQSSDELRVLPIPEISGTSSRGFTQLTSLVELSDGTVLVTDPEEGALYAVEFDTEGVGAIRQIGRRGQGPEEYDEPRWLHRIAGDSVLLIDGTRSRWHTLAGTEFTGLLPGHAPVAQELWQVVGVLDGAVVEVVGTQWEAGSIPGRSTADSLGIRLAHRAWEHRDALPRIDTLLVGMAGAGPGGMGGCAMASGGASREPICGDLFPVEDQAVVLDGRRLAIVRHDPYRVSIRSPPGAWTHGPEIEFDARRLRPDERCAAAGGWNFRGVDRCAGRDYGPRRPPESATPFIRSIPSSRALPRTRPVLPAPNGRLLVRRTPSLSTIDSTMYDVFDASGSRVARVTLPANEAILGFGSTSVYTVRTDEFDLQWLRRHELFDGW